MTAEETPRPTIEFPWQQIRQYTHDELRQVAAGNSERGLYLFAGIAIPVICIAIGIAVIVFQNDSSGAFPVVTGISVGAALMHRRYRDRLAAYRALLENYTGNQPKLEP